MKEKKVSGNSKYKSIDLFAGIGGIRIGFVLPVFRVRLLVLLEPAELEEEALTMTSKE